MNTFIFICQGKGIVLKMNHNVPLYYMNELEKKTSRKKFLGHMIQTPKVGRDNSRVWNRGAQTRAGRKRL